MDQVEGDDLLCLVQRIKAETGKGIWIYSGYTFEQIMAHERRREILACCDVLVDGLFELKLRDLKLKFRGSSNQRIIDVPKSMKLGEAVLVSEYM